MAYLPEFVDRSVPATARVEESDDAIQISIVGQAPPASSMVATPGVVKMSPDILMGAAADDRTRTAGVGAED